ncbi:MAG TPA: DUF3093 family protein, partial [Cellulomonas sp.]|nr:DUF3093 family protein [Cellulomonas sp.]
MAGNAPVTHTFSERLWLGPLGWFGLVGLAVCLGIAVFPIDTVLAVVVVLVAIAALAVLAVVTTTTVEVADDELHAGAAHIPVHLLGDVRVLDADELRAEL